MGNITVISNAESLKSTCSMCAAIISVPFIFFGILQQAHAQSNEGFFRIGETKLYPEVRLNYFTNSNAFLEPADETDVTGFEISPTLNWEADRRLLTLNAEYQGDYANHSEEAMNYDDHSFSASVSAELDSRKRADAAARIRFGHQELGTNFTRGVADANTDQVEFTDLQLRGSFVYGANRARGNLELGAAVEKFSYSNRSDVTAGGDYEQLEPYGIFSLRLSGDTRTFLESRIARVSFDNSRNDRQDVSLLAGLSFAASGKSSGSFRVGNTWTQFDLSNRDDETNIVVEADLLYQPLSYSQLELEVARSLYNRDLSAADATLDSLVVRDSYSLTWRHEWSGRFSHLASLERNVLVESCPQAGISNDKISLELNLAVRRWLTVGLNASRSDRTATDCDDVASTSADLDYDRQLVGIHLHTTL